MKFHKCTIDLDWGQRYPRRHHVYYFPFQLSFDQLKEIIPMNIRENQVSWQEISMSNCAGKTIQKYEESVDRRY